MKQLIALVLVLALLVGLTACGLLSATPGAASTGANETKTQTPETDAPKTEPGAEPPAFEEITVLDNEFCTVKIIDYTEDDNMGPSLTFHLENHMADRTLRFDVEDTSIDGVSWPSNSRASLDPEEQENIRIKFVDDRLQELLAPYTIIKMTLLLQSNGEHTEELARETIRFYPRGEDEAAPYVRQPQPTDLVLTDSDELSITCLGLESDENIGNCTVKLYLVNKSEHSIWFSLDGSSINGSSIATGWNSIVPPEAAEFTELSWSLSMLEQKGIKEVEEIVLELYAEDMDHILDGEIYRDTVTLRP